MKIPTPIPAQKELPMARKIFLIRHCEADGQEAEAKLTEEGLRQAQKLCKFLKNEHIDHIVSSPFERAIRTIEPLSAYSDLKINIEHRLVEKKLSASNMDGWMDKLKASFEDLSLCYEGGESSIDAMSRGVQVIRELLKTDKDHIAVVTHGAILTLMLKNFNNDVGFDEWKNLLTPDIYLIRFNENEEAEVLRLLI